MAWKYGTFTYLHLLDPEIPIDQLLPQTSILPLHMNQSLGASFNIIQLAGEIFGSLPPKPQFWSIKKTGNIIFMDIHYIHTGTVWEWVMPPMASSCSLVPFSTSDLHRALSQTSS